MKVGKKHHLDKKTRVCPYLDSHLYESIRLLAFSCRESEAKMALEMIKSCLASEHWVAMIQDKYGVKKDSPDRVINTRVDGKPALMRMNP